MTGRVVARSPLVGGPTSVPATSGTATSVPAATVSRLPGYLHALDGLHANGTAVVTSQELARAAGVTSVQLRKDLSFLGSYGRRGVGYDVEHLRHQVADVLGVREPHSVVLVGLGNLGHALAHYGGFADRGFTLVGLVDADPALVGTEVAGLVVEPPERLAELVGRTGATIGVIATPAGVAQDVCDALVAAGVTGVLTFAPRALRVPAHVDVRAVDVASELQILAFHARRPRA
ncbi:redox-sensing transcriptional repressor Rex [Cellulomonas sp. DKR-3]|uniref:Redox-sensing transcriptional repressor Rex n=1 Tax=Cellulomonas fulva TaxID=2835530 RepID=A0ABS5TYI5_9CELL|nr:redox-sensing transcriptional repressor Rex [Cellulomonas fulva]